MMMNPKNGLLKPINDWQHESQTMTFYPKHPVKNLHEKPEEIMVNIFSHESVVAL